MIPSELVVRLAHWFPSLTSADVQASVSIILDAIASLTSGGRVEIRGFGPVSVIPRKPRLARNPRSGDRVRIPAKDSTADHVRNFLDCMRTRKECRCSLEDGHRSTTYAHLANIALKTRSRLEDMRQSLSTLRARIAALVG